MTWFKSTIEEQNSDETKVSKRLRIILKRRTAVFKETHRRASLQARQWIIYSLLPDSPTIKLGSIDGTQNNSWLEQN